MPAPQNPIKAAMAARRVLRGPFLSLSSETAAEIAGRAAFDYVLIDAEHGAFDPVGIRRQLMALAGAGMPSVVRVPANEPWIFKQVLDLGAQTVMVPMVNTGEQAEAAVRACRFPPGGSRGLGGANMRAGGYGDIANYPTTANDQICIMAQVESREGIANLDAIASTDGIDCVFIGPADLACDMGYADDLGAPQVWDLITETIARLAESPAAAGVFAGPDREAAMRAAGATVFGIGSDAGLLTQAMQHLAEPPA